MADDPTDTAPLSNPDRVTATAALPVCSRCQRKIITFDGSRPTICGNCQPDPAARWDDGSDKSTFSSAPTVTFTQTFPPDPTEPDLTLGLKIMLSVLVAAVACMVILAVLNG